MDREAKRRKSGRERILDAACELFYEQGIRSVGVGAMVARAGVAKMTLYNNFESKDDLVVAYLERRDDEVRRWIKERVEQAGRSPRERLLGIFDAFAERVEKDGFRGCHLINALVELTDRTHPAGQLARDNNWLYRDYAVELAREAGAPDPEAFGRQVFLLLEGAFVVSTMEMSAESMRQARATAEALLAATDAEPRG